MNIFPYLSDPNYHPNILWSFAHETLIAVFSLSCLIVGGHFLRLKSLRLSFLESITEKEENMMEEAELSEKAELERLLKVTEEKKQRAEDMIIELLAKNKQIGGALTLNEIEDQVKAVLPTLHVWSIVAKLRGEGRIVRIEEDGNLHYCVK